MKPTTKDQIEGQLHALKGQVKEKTGQVTNNPDMAAEGQREKVAGETPKKCSRSSRAEGGRCE
jgi:uncharacterized protein YjbJ (UPF0337 family)